MAQSLKRPMGTTQFLNATLAQDKPIFGHTKVNHTPSHPVTHLVSSNRRVVLVLANKTVQKVDQSSPSSSVENADLNKLVSAKTKVHAAFLDPHGHHLVLSLKSLDGQEPELLHWATFNKPRVCSGKSKGHLVTAVAWTHSSKFNEKATGPMLCGTTRGLIVETELQAASESTTAVFSSSSYSVEKYWRQVYDIGKGGQALTGIEYHRVPRTNKYFILATTATRLYQFQGYVNDQDQRPLLVNVFNDYLHVPEKFLDLPSSLKYSQLAFFYQTNKTLPLYPKTFGWFTEPGIYSGRIDPYEGDNDTVTVDCSLISLPGMDEQPFSFVLTEFHAVLAYKTHVKGICLLNEQIVFDDDLEVPIKGISRDPLTGTIFVFSDYVVHKYLVDREERNVWKVYLQKGNFELALKYCGNDIAKMDQVLTRQAEDFFDRGLYVESAMQYAKTITTSFEEVALKFIQVDEKTSLLHFLKKRLEVIKPSEKTQLTMVVVWLVEIYLNMMGAKANAPRQTADLTAEDIEAVADALDDQTSEELLALMQIPKVADCISQNRNTFYSLLSSHGDKTNLIKFASMMDDYDRVIGYHLQDNEFEPVLQVLEDQLLLKGQPQLFYQYGPALMQTIPRHFVDSIIKQGRRLNPLKLIPSLVVSSRGDQEVEAVRYLEHCVKSLESKDPAVHNYLLSLYIKHSHHDKVLPYLLKCGTDLHEVKYDVKYALRLCSEKGDLKKECVMLYCILGQLEEAVGLCLDSLTLEEAKECLAYARDEEQSRKVWLMIAGHVVKNRNDIRQAMEFLQECNGLVKIEDILPFFPDFVTIDHFKDAICDSLQEYSAHIQELKDEMEEAYSSAERIRQDIRGHKARYTFVRATDTCCVCSSYLMAKPFHLFSCGHRFHTECLMESVAPHLSSARKKKVDQLLVELSSKRNKDDDDVQSVDSRTAKLSRKDQLRAELDDLVASECVFCGDIMIKMIDKPFIDEQEFENVVQEWL